MGRIQYTGVWDQFGVADGLPDMKIECLFEDSQHTLWIGTRSKGLVRYSGDEFTSYTSRDGLSGNEVFAVREAADEGIWVATNNGLCVWRGTSFEAVEAADGLSFLWGVADGLDGHLWFGVERRPNEPARICHWDGIELTVVPLERSSTVAGRSIHAIAIDEENTIWCGGHGLFAIDGTDVREIEPPPNEYLDVKRLCATADGSVIVATESGTYRVVDSELIKIPELGANVECLCRSASGDAWAGTSDGVLVRVESRGVTEVGSIDLPLWRAMTEDRKGRIWLGSYGFGMHCFDETRVRVADASSGLSDNTVQALATHEGKVWIGTRNGLTTDDGTPLSELAEIGDDYSAENVTGLLSDSLGRLWIGKRNGYMYVFDGGVVRQCATVQDMRHYSIDVIVEALDGSVWVASSLGGGLARYASPTEVEKIDVGPTSDFPARVGAIAVAPDGTMAFGSSVPQSWDGIAELRDGEFSKIEGIEGCEISALCYDSEGRLWIGTTEGVAVCDSDFVTAYTTEDGLPSDLITALYADEQGRIWIGTEGGGLAVFDGRVFQVLQIPHRPFCNSINAIVQDAAGAIWLGTNGGVVQRRLVTGEVLVRITEVVADGSYLEPAAVQFPDTVGRVTIGFRGQTDIGRSSNLVYRYRLEGHESDWHQGSERTADYPQLEPGEYKFEVQAIDQDLNYSAFATVALTVVADPRIDGLRRALRAEGATGEFVGESQTMQLVMRQITEVAWTDLTVLVLGETGTGKGLAAQQIHELSERRSGPLIHVNCGSVQESLVDSELFGHEKGAFTGALARRLGKFELANGGTIFLDEIGDLPLESQARLLQVLQDKTIERIGGSQSITVDVRVIAATNRDLDQAVRESTYRADLYYRLNVFPIVMPPLRERKEDTLLLAHHFIATFASHLSKPAPQMTRDVEEALVAYGWPGNVRELEHTVQRAVILAHDGEIRLEHLGLQPQFEGNQKTETEQPILPLAEFERRYFERVLRHTGGVIHGDAGAAKLLDMKPTTLRSRLEKLGIRSRKTHSRLIHKV